MELISNRRRYGEFDGEVMISQSSFESTKSVDRSNSSTKVEFSGLSASESMAFVPRDAVSLYLPGLTYYETLCYAARLRMRNPEGLSSSAMNEIRAKRVADILDIMQLTWCKDRVIAERPTARGILGGELRKMAIAVEIISLPPVIVLADITEGLDATVSSDIVRTLATLASRGHTVVCSFAKIYPEEVKSFDKITLISKGYSIYSSTPENVSLFFSSINFECGDSNFDVGEFLLDVGNGTERPVGERRAPEANALQAKFEESDYYEQYQIASGSGDNYSSQVLGGVSTGSDFLFGLKNGLIAMERAWYSKFKEVEVFKKSFFASIGLSLFFGYFAFNLGDSNEYEYCAMLIPFPYSSTSTTTSIMYISTAVQMGMQGLNVHIFFQKQKVFFYERASGVVALPSYVLSTVLSEFPLAGLFSLIFGTIVYFMLDLGVGMYNYLWWVAVLQVTAHIGLMTVLVFTSVIKHELAVRDFFLYCLISMIW